jgi:hypothetical protein
MRFYLTLFTLAVMLLFRLPPICKAIGGFRRSGGQFPAKPVGDAKVTPTMSAGVYHG